MKKLMAICLVCLFWAGSALAVVNINTASQQELETLKGVGPAKAKAIVDFRTQNGPFKSVDDLDKVKGIGAGILNKIRSEITIGGAAPVSTVKPVATGAAVKAVPASPAVAATPAKPATLKPAVPPKKQ